MLINKHMMISENSISVQLVFFLVQCKEWMSVSADIVNRYVMTYRSGKIPHCTMNKGKNTEEKIFVAAI